MKNYTDDPLLDGESEVGVDSKCDAGEGDQDDLQDEDDDHDDDEDAVASDAFEDVLLFVQLPAVKEVEYLHHHERIEDKREVPGVDVGLVEDISIVVGSVDLLQSPRAHCVSIVTVLVFGVVLEYGVVEAAGVLGDEFFAFEDKHQHHDQLEDGLPDDVLEHGATDDVVLPGVRGPVQQFFSWGLGGKGQGSQGVHD